MLLQTVYVYGIRKIQKGSILELSEIVDEWVAALIDGYKIIFPRHLITIIPPDSPRVHKHKKISHKRK